MKAKYDGRTNENVLTRIGFNSKAVITGDVTQIDLPRSTKSGLRHAMEVLSKVGIKL